MVNNNFIALSFRLVIWTGLLRKSYLACTVYSGTLLTQSPMSQKNLALLMGDHINKGFSQENVWPFCQVPKKSDHNNKVTAYYCGGHGQGSTVFAIFTSDLYHVQNICMTWFIWFNL